MMSVPGFCLDEDVATTSFLLRPPLTLVPVGVRSLRLLPGCCPAGLQAPRGMLVCITPAPLISLSVTVAGDAKAAPSSMPPLSCSKAARSAAAPNV
jgi:hypothetical protein